MTSSNGSLEKLRAVLAKDITVEVYGEAITFKVMVPDMAQFFKNMKIGNPILEALQEAMKMVSEKTAADGQFSFAADGLLGELSPIIAKAISDNETYNSVIDNINRTLHGAIIEPKLGEPGSDELNIEHIPITAKVKMLTEMYGGSNLLNSLTIFRNGQTSTVLTRRKGETVRDTAKQADGDQ